MQGRLQASIASVCFEGKFIFHVFAIVHCQALMLSLEGIIFGFFQIRNCTDKAFEKRAVAYGGSEQIVKFLEGTAGSGVNLCSFF